MDPNCTGAHYHNWFQFTGRFYLRLRSIKMAAKTRFMALEVKWLKPSHMKTFKHNSVKNTASLYIFSQTPKPLLTVHQSCPHLSVFVQCDCSIVVCIMHVEQDWEDGTQHRLLHQRIIWAVLMVSFIELNVPLWRSVDATWDAAMSKDSFGNTQSSSMFQNKEISLLRMVSTTFLLLL